MEALFEFEKPIANLEKKLQELRELAKQGGMDFSSEITVLEKKVSTMIDETYSKLTPWQRVQLSRHPNRPYTRDYVDLLFPDFMELHGDRTFSDDQAVLCGVATWPPHQPSDPAALSPPTPENPVPPVSDPSRIPVLIIGHQKGRTTKQKIERNFAMAKPEGYRKVMRLLQLAERTKMPVITFIDTPGAYPGMDAEERGQSQAIAESIALMFSLNVPIISVVIGEGGSGGALAIGVANTVLMQEFSYYSVIAPESCAAILWSDSSLAERAAERLKTSPADLLKLGVIDDVVPEPKGGAHRDWKAAAEQLRKKLVEYMEPMLQKPAKAEKAATKSSAKASAKSTAKAASKKLPVVPDLSQGLAQARLDKFRAMGNIALAHAPLEGGDSG